MAITDVAMQNRLRRFVVCSMIALGLHQFISGTASLVQLRPVMHFVALLLIVARTAAAQPQTMTVTKLANGIYGAIWSEMESDPVQGNALIIIGDSSVCVVDAHYTPSAARATIAAIRRLTHFPVRYVVTTHWHDDHVFGNQAYRAAFPGVEFVAHAQTRALMLTNAQAHRDELLAAYANTVTRVTKALSTGKKSNGTTVTAEERANYIARLPLFKRYAEDFRAVRPVYPTITFEHSLTLLLGTREVQIRNFGYGNTEGDAVVYLPKEKIAAVGDLVVYPVPYIYGGFPDVWVRTLDSVRALGATVIVPGHGPVMRDYAFIDQVSGLLKSLAAQARSAVGRGLSVDSLRKVIDLKVFHDAMAPGHVAGEGTFMASIMNAGVEAAYEEAKTNATQPTRPSFAARSRSAVLDSARSVLRRAYVDADTGRLIADYLSQREQAHAYDSILDRRQLAQALSRDVRAVNGDKHLAVLDGAPSSTPASRSSDDALIRNARRSNFGLRRAEILDGNIGYLDVIGFLEAPGADDAIANALRFLERTDAIIVDLRRNGGGSSEMSHMLFSHFLGATPVRTIRVRDRRDGSDRIRTSLAKVPGPRRPTVPLYVLTSTYSASAAEEFAFVMRNNGRATVVGEHTAGAGHMNTFFDIGNGFQMSVSVRRVSDPVSGAEWERVGVLPNVEATASSALEVAIQLAKQAIAGRSSSATALGANPPRGAHTEP